MESSYSLPSYIKMDSCKVWHSKRRDNIDNGFLEEKRQRTHGPSSGIWRNSLEARRECVCPNIRREASLVCFLNTRWADRHWVVKGLTATSCPKGATVVTCSPIEQGTRGAFPISVKEKDTTLLFENHNYNHYIELQHDPTQSSKMHTCKMHLKCKGGKSETTYVKRLGSC